jgi:RNA polymerase sigma-70 factor (sigma-E family)
LLTGTQPIARPAASIGRRHEHGTGGCKGSGDLVASLEEEFTEFVAASGARLRRTAFMLCGNWHTAEDLTQTALAKVFASWRRIGRPDSVHAYAERTLVNTYLAHRRTRSARELVTSQLPEHPVEPAGADLRLVVLDALAQLGPRARAAVILRYWEDLSVDQVAALMGCSPGTVKSLCSRALDKLRPLLGDAVPQSEPSSPPGIWSAITNGVPHHG